MTYSVQFQTCQTSETIQEFFESLEKIAKWNSKLSSVLLAYVSPYEHFKRQSQTNSIYPRKRSNTLHLQLLFDIVEEQQIFIYKLLLQIVECTNNNLGLIINIECKSKPFNHSISQDNEISRKLKKLQMCYIASNQIIPQKSTFYTNKTIKNTTM